MILIRVMFLQKGRSAPLFPLDGSVNILYNMHMTKSGILMMEKIQVELLHAEFGNRFYWHWIKIILVLFFKLFIYTV